MLLTSAQFIIIISTLFIIIFHIIAMYKYSESFQTSTINVNNLSLAWLLLENYSAYKNWWTKFTEIEDAQSVVKILQSNKYNILRIVIYGQMPHLDEIWTFYFIKNKNNYQLKINRRLPKIKFMQRLMQSFNLDNKNLRTFKQDFYKIFNVVQKNYEAQNNPVQQPTVGKNQILN